uniref:Uncharacterized protein n=1 Tax=Aureoumbra lagunensis TaxID=44058 RepID=A0A7S3K4S3_9STRA|mmetsp:Transcript_20639/g.26726  ORF Transcript_20639/g.26726 Transcript_20639/m.26726 type:complete len:107 (+) Transcript_20639:30-350(+)|eukprot:CAMPEP_0197286004 /NCGR_PEP_ID=MMETSP0890-20130614/1387_1 /TAXON_ID=44058 ORGANISM="Aureoumbra lagunensis, Strain CCMP1510" /NCGR_SAMPLE_ID=MMETSP0890 /ASSEMBLY_ACC=CAM_ASM_000533 /LENGTH=106 /DNA_ID=CAMNT_0042753975 /DNA_START=30 /DNA_END=350 /DNA_ORIENTATION=-
MMKLNARLVLLTAVALFVVTEAFAPKPNALTNVRSARVVTNATPKMEVWSEKNIRVSLLAGIGLPLVGLVTSPDNAVLGTVLPLAIAGIWIYIFFDVLKAALPSSD